MADLLQDLKSIETIMFARRDPVGQQVIRDAGAEIERLRAQNVGGNEGQLKTVVAAYLAARDAKPEQDCWDTESGEEEPGAQRFASDWAWADHHDRVAKALAALRAAATVEATKNVGENVG